MYETFLAAVERTGAAEAGSEPSNVFAPPPQPPQSRNKAGRRVRRAPRRNRSVERRQEVAFLRLAVANQRVELKRLRRENRKWRRACALLDELLRP